ncbi:redoxin family protein [Pseudoalteromonas sp. S4498]|uniref:TlpA family protein disulfide reductase n=1 Tax=Pseudoalteromonas TaxID=53246 RepID=UPI00110937B2|nr:MULTISPECIES: TlpA disulfide reductase family protein [Pseudoalteromonas]MCG9759529.1 TlpA family protein disulfide reductase [Pseudoalteromonas sp. Isolate6]NKC20448.1 redoxin family protein [Pseudoalteromonas galatheae]
MKYPIHTVLLCTTMACTAPVYANSPSPVSFEATGMNGESLPVGDKPIYLKFWATWCSYCLEEMPHLQETYEKTNEKLEVISVNVGFNQNEPLVRRFLDRHNYTIPTIFDQRGQMVEKFKIVGTPTHILLDAQGNEVFRSALLTDELKEKLKRLQ